MPSRNEVEGEGGEEAWFREARPSYPSGMPKGMPWYRGRKVNHRGRYQESVNLPGVYR